MTTGEVVQVGRATVEQFESADNPDTGFTLGDVVAPFRAVVTALRR